tara:strand:+ start:2463 stop:3155 length:693 start_codon:yes stop_codon:yes gene_type:complete
MKRNNQKGFALVLSLMLLLAMSLMGGSLIVIASTDHEGNNSGDEYQQTFYVAETALMQAEKSLLDKMLGPQDNNGDRNRNDKFVPINISNIPDDEDDMTPCYRSFRNLSRDENFQLVEHVKDQSFFDLIAPILTQSDLTVTLDSADAKYAEKKDDQIALETANLQRYRYEFFSVNSGTSIYKGSGISLKKTSGTTQRQGSVYRIYGCGMLGNANNPQILIPLETIVVLAH